MCVYYMTGAPDGSPKTSFVAFPRVVTITGLRGFMICMLFYDENTRRLNQKWFYGEAGNRTCDPWLTRHRFIPYTTEQLL